MLVCVYCQSSDVLRNGSRKTISGNRQRFVCKGCKKTFVENNLLKKFKGKPETLTLVLDLYFKGLSLRKIHDHLKQFYGLKIHYSTIYRWVIRFTKEMESYTKKLQPKLSGIWHADEQMIKVKGKWKWNWNVLDEKTRFLIANKVTNGRDISDARKVFKESKEITSTIPKAIVTDGLWSYEKAIGKEFSKWKLPRTEHIRLSTIKEKPDNNLIKRFHNTFRERDKIIRGFKKNDNNITNGFRTYYNFIRPNMALNNLTPAQASGIELGLDNNRWLGLINHSVNNNIERKPKQKQSETRYIIKGYDKNGNEVDMKELGLKSKFQDEDKAKKFIEFYETVYPNHKFEVIRSEN